MDLNMLALEVLGAIFEGVINEVIAPIEILVVTEDYIFVGSRQILLAPQYLLIQGVWIAPWCCREDIDIKMLSESIVCFNGARYWL